ncbi:Protein N-acetyltransferase, RimJ/RimL family [Hathewaya proteolytica DSM 3090]|uniref:Protein N-acetyltransferase, RimJ/RimL family n=1 Tax=Hathewaya proteolytica DSM 3090 TaxID=1121331 RepID=A0A1M6MSC3_9CLOT|nr:GNAT family N-acetyltransferase [Hathewaya proteolytica]SHJ86299.1 Protein N-acetyltransferase, RimJ/RimL family [Hathewaya proteolytica DSM 3090]
MKSDISLRQEVYRPDAYKIIDWLRDTEVTQYLNEDRNASRSIENAINTVNMPILTHLFNNNSSFYIITNEDDSIGFIRLVPKGSDAEIVIAIGERELWGLGLGKAAILEGLKEAFFTWRVNSVIANIKFENIRSRRAFKKVGFKEVKKLDNEVKYMLTMRDFLKIVA